ncbi:MAG: hypothetical protein M9933_18935 [Chitinophagaceae bacterium]|nr:hypothetical protein [Chitinophagaceae bacterium]
MKYFLPLLLTFSSLGSLSYGQTCNPRGNQTDYGTNNKWIGYVYDNKDFTSYKGYVNEGAASSPDFDQNFGGSNVMYATKNCSVQTETFSIRYKLKKEFSAGTYLFTVGGDDGYRLSLDGGATWVINGWVDQSYTVRTFTIALNGTYNMVLEFYENGGENRISFSVVQTCRGTENTNTYGTNNIWNGYVYDGINFDIYAGMVHEGSAGNPDFDQNFGGAVVSYATSACPVETETFSVRYRLTKTFDPGTYMFTIGGDDGFRFSVDDGATWLINNWNLHSYTTTSQSLSLSGTHDLVLEYYENAVDNRVSFSMRTLSILPISLLSFSAREKKPAVELNWEISSQSDPRKFEIERSSDGAIFENIGTVFSNNSTRYSFTDRSPIGSLMYYRLKMTDLGGAISYSPIVNIRLNPASITGVNVYPTVVTGNSFFVVSDSNIRNAVITITGFNGKTVSRQYPGNISAGQAIRVSTGSANLEKGLYAVTLSGNEFGITTSKIIIQ